MDKNSSVLLKQHDNVGVTRMTSKLPCIRNAILISFFSVALISMAVWNFRLNMEVNDLSKRLNALEISIPQTDDVNDKGQHKPLKRSPRKTDKKVNKFCKKLQRCDTKKFESIHMVIDGKKKATILKSGQKITEWKVDQPTDQTTGVTYNKNTGDISVNTAGYYNVYAQLRPHQDSRRWVTDNKNLILVPEWFVFYIHKNDVEIAATSWNSTLTSQSLSRTVYLNTNDKVSVALGVDPYGPFKCYCDNKFTSFGLFLLSAE